MKNKELNRIVNKFDRQIVNEYKYENGNKYRCLSYWSKIIFLESINFDLNDWKKLRTPKYWEERDYLQSILNKLNFNLNNLNINQKQKKEIVKKIKTISLQQKKLLFNSIKKHKNKYINLN